MMQPRLYSVYHTPRQSTTQQTLQIEAEENVQLQRNVDGDRIQVVLDALYVSS